MHAFPLHKILKLRDFVLVFIAEMQEKDSCESIKQSVDT